MSFLKKYKKSELGFALDACLDGAYVLLERVLERAHEIFNFRSFLRIKSKLPA
jgi:hypothetical protein